MTMKPTAERLFRKDVTGEGYVYRVSPAILFEIDPMIALFAGADPIPDEQTTTEYVFVLRGGPDGVAVYPCDRQGRVYCGAIARYLTRTHERALEFEGYEIREGVTR